jgi:clan AA aspartic protease (TIGR02281 family)
MAAGDAMRTISLALGTALIALAGCATQSASPPVWHSKAPSEIGIPVPVTHAPGLAQPNAPRADAEAAITTDHNTKSVTGVINGAVQVSMMIDSGASLVSIPIGLAAHLAEIGTLQIDEDYIRHDTFEMADGHTHAEPIIRLHSLTVGGVTINNVEASVGKDGSPILLGQSFLSRLGAWQIDNARNALVMRAA